VAAYHSGIAKNEGEDTMNGIRRILAGLAGIALALAAAPAAFATLPPGSPRGAGARSSPVVTHTVVAGGMPGWQIALIAIGAALAAAIAAVLADRARMERKLHASTA
jgi:hypothetical protein